MEIIIAGAGKVGFELARSLSGDHQVTVIDENIEALNRLQELIDILPIVGNVEDPITYSRLPSVKADLFIAVTDSDEANLLATLLIDDVVKIAKKVIRLRNSYFSKSHFLSNLENLTTVFPFSLAAETIGLLFEYPEANNVKQLAGTTMKLISIRVDNPLHEEKFVGLFENTHIKIVGIEREKQFFIPAKDELVRHGDLLYFLGSGDVLKRMYHELDMGMPQEVHTAVIFGAKTLGIEIARILITRGISVKIVEKSITHCEEASRQLQDKVLVINSHYDENILYEEEHLAKADVMIATDKEDEANIIKALQAKEQGIPKVIAINNEKRYYALMHQLGIVVARGPRTSAYYAILESLSSGSSSSVSAKHFCGGEGVVLYYVTTKVFSGHRRSPWREEESILLIERGKVWTLWEEKMILESGDKLCLVTKTVYEEKARGWMESL